VNEEEWWVVVAIENRELNIEPLLIACSAMDDPAQLVTNARIANSARESGLRRQMIYFYIDLPIIAGILEGTY